MWTTQTHNMGRSVKLVVYWHEWTGRQPATFHAFRGEEERGRAVEGLTRRILQRYALGKYRTAIFYRDGVELERWENGLRRTP